MFIALVRTPTIPRELDFSRPAWTPQAPDAFGKPHRLKGLDALRGVAALSVVIYHFTCNYERVYHHTAPPAVSFHLGALGVQLFFLISGFVIMMTIERTRRPADFVRSRFSRLFPAYWAAVFLTAAVVHALPLPGRIPSASRLLMNLTMVQGLFGVGHVDPVYWTLQVELCFYGFMLLVLSLGHARHAEWYLVGLVVLNLARILAEPHLSTLGSAHPRLMRAGNWLADVFFLDFACVFLIGLLLYRLSQGVKPIHVGLLAACLAFEFRFIPRVDFIATAAFIVAIISATQGYLKRLEYKPMLYLGTISYTLYLTHQNIGYAIIRALEARRVHPNLAIFVAICAALLIASALTFAVERPAMRLLRRRSPQNTAAAIESKRDDAQPLVAVG